MPYFAGNCSRNYIGLAVLCPAEEETPDMVDGVPYKVFWHPG
jgi:hypothetical protein